MDRVQFNNQWAFAAEPYKGKVRFVVYANKAEVVCRIESVKNIQQFLKALEARIFKGRLQLNKTSTKINVEVKGEKVGSVSLKEFKNILQALAE